MKEEIKIPSLGESISSATIVAWLKGDGDYVEEGEDLYELESDKAGMAVPSPATGTLEIRLQEESDVETGQVVGIVDTDASPPQEDVSESTDTEPADKKPPPEKKPDEQQQPPTSPAARRAMAEKGVSSAEVEGSGKQGRILKEDVERTVEKPKRDMAEAEKASAMQHRQKMSRIRRTIAANLVRSQQQSAHLTTFNEIDMKRLMEIRSQYKEQFQQTHGLKLGFMSFFIKACCSALKRYPEANSFIDGDTIVYNQNYNIGIAVSTERGLVVPIIRDADTLTIDEVEKTVVSLADKARNKKISVQEMSGGTFTITNGGVFGSLLSTPIPTPPQSAVLGMHTIQERPVVLDGQIVARPMMYTALTYDHRILDGREAVGFLITVKQLIEAPEKMLLNL